MYKGIEENKVAHMIDENMTYYSGEQYGYKDCYMFKCGTLTNYSTAMKNFNEIEREIGAGILSEIKKRAIDKTNIDTLYYIVPIDEVIDVYDTYEHNETVEEKDEIEEIER